jgi:hypothetical protein
MTFHKKKISILLLGVAHQQAQTYPPSFSGLISPFYQCSLVSTYNNQINYRLYFMEEAR